MLMSIFLNLDMDTLPEWSKGVDSSSTSASRVGSNPTGVILTARTDCDSICWGGPERPSPKSTQCRDYSLHHHSVACTSLIFLLFVAPRPPRILQLASWCQKRPARAE